MTTTIKPHGAKTERLHHERWEDEGGQTTGIEVPVSAGRFVRLRPKTSGFQDIPRQWSTKFIIEPFEPGTGSHILKRDAAAGKKRLFRSNLIPPKQGTLHE